MTFLLPLFAISVTFSFISKVDFGYVERMGCCLQIFGAKSFSDYRSSAQGRIRQ